MPKMRKQIISPHVRFAASSRGPYANKLGGGMYAKSFGLREATPSFHAFGADAEKVIMALVRGSGNVNFTGAAGRTVTDFEGLSKNIQEDEIAHERARRVENIVGRGDGLESTEDMTANGWTYVNHTAQYQGNGITRFTNDSGEVASIRTDAISGDVSTRDFVVAMDIRRVSGSGRVDFYRPNGGTIINITALVTSEFKRFALSGPGGGTLTRWRVNTYDLNDTFDIRFPSHEEVTGQTNQNVSEYVSYGVESSDQYHGANVDGVKYFAYENGNTVDGDNIVTEAKGADLTTPWKTRFNPTVDNGAGMFDFANFDITKGSFVFDLTMDAALAQGVINFANAEAGVCSYDLTNQFQTDDGTNQSNVDPSLSANLGDIIRFSILYSTTGGLRIGYRNVTDVGSWVWGTPAPFDGSFASNSVFNAFFGLAASSTLRDLFYYTSDIGESSVESAY